jgi:hypothetical protein
VSIRRYFVCVRRRSSESEVFMKLAMMGLVGVLVSAQVASLMLTVDDDS